MTFKEFENLKVTEDEILIALACKEFNISPFGQGFDENQLLRYYKGFMETVVRQSQEKDAK